MKAYTYINTKTNLPNWVSDVHEIQKYGYGYETDTHFIHFFGKEQFYIISVGLTVIEGKNNLSFNEWVERRFGAINIEEMNLEVGNTIEGIWRPSLYYWDDIKNGLNIDLKKQRSQEQALRSIIEKLDEILLFIEPSVDGLNSYGHKIRELLILSCTEIENQWQSVLNQANYLPINNNSYTTKDYIKLKPILFLEDFRISLRNYSAYNSINPFTNWNLVQPTQSLIWYDAYNKTKHHREQYFASAKLHYAIDAVAANIILYCSQYSPLILINETNILASLIKQLFEIELISIDRKSFYIPLLSLPANARQDCFVTDCYSNKLNSTWKINNLQI